MRGHIREHGSLIRSGRSIVLERTLTKNMLASGGIEEMARCFNNSYPMNDMGRRGKSGNRVRVIVGKELQDHLSLSRYGEDR